jgi:LPXTG-site transpeptidase (sortase) family protein
VKTTTNIEDILMKLTIAAHAAARRFLAFALVLLMLTILTAPAAAVEGTRLSIPALNVDNVVSEFPLNGVSWNIDPWFGGVGHLQGTGWFDQGGNIAIGGHSWMPDRTAGIFVALHTLQPGDVITVSHAGGERQYTVSSVTSVAITDLSVLYPTGGEQLTLITCDGASYDRNSNLYQRRVIVVAQRSG